MNKRPDIGTWAEEFGGVFTLGDLRALNGNLSEAGVYKKLERMIARGELVKVKRGFYALPSASLAAISARIEPTAYVSTGTALSRHLRIGSVPVRRLQAVKIGVPRTYACPLGTIEHLSIAPRLFFGFSVENGIRMATPEKAWLDACYYAYKGRTFSFDLDTDVDRSGLDGTLLAEYLDLFDPRFRAAYERLWGKP
ncbi:MAG TPA: type IV toxin-antitoxin system AbiEi family antitoxin domain-containing protein [Kiritimatiellia bacterium]|nr:type IV toxin-antitoxin system AbiEi family antitoxin domain-containing protein [Kiritimatiellia bacterium]